MSEATNRAALDRVFTEDIVMEWPHRYASAARSGP